MSKCHLGVVQKEKVAATCKVGFPKKWKVIREIKRPDLLVQAVQPLCPLPASIKSYLSARILPQTMEETMSNTPSLLKLKHCLAPVPPVSCFINWEERFKA